MQKVLRVGIKVRVARCRVSTWTFFWSLLLALLFVTLRGDVRLLRITSENGGIRDYFFWSAQDESRNRAESKNIEYENEKWDLKISICWALFQSSNCFLVSTLFCINCSSEFKVRNAKCSWKRGEDLKNKRAKFWLSYEVWALLINHVRTFQSAHYSWGAILPSRPTSKLSSHLSSLLYQHL